MSVSNIPQKVRQVLFGLAAGRCQYRGCNKLLTEDHLTRRQGKFSVFAHIIADEPGGPRGDPQLSKKLAKDITNIMLLCLDHHRLVDVDAEEDHPVELLREFKAEHEDRVRRLTDIQGEHRTLIVRMVGNIGTRKGLVGSEILDAVLPRYPNPDVVDIEPARLRVADGGPASWAAGVEEIEARAAQVHELALRHDVDHISVFALAPIPLLMKLGLALGDIGTVIPHQRRRHPPGWDWLSPHGEPEPFVLVQHGDEAERVREVALVISVSDAVDLAMVAEAAPEGATLFELRVETPMTDIIRSLRQVRSFRRAVREALTAFRSAFGGDITVRVFPAVPNSLAVAFGQALLPKADPCIVVHDMNQQRGGWIEALELLKGA